MSARGINHVSVNATDLDESVAFYVDLFGAVLLATPNFGLPVQWLGIGDSQVHLFQREADPQSHHHFAITVDDLEPVYRRAEARGCFDRVAFHHHLVELPGDIAQTYIRDPAGNLIELDTPGASRLPEALRRELKPLGEFNPQSEENLRGRLFVRDAVA